MPFVLFVDHRPPLEKMRPVYGGGVPGRVGILPAERRILRRGLAGNKVRLITAIHFNRRKVYIRAVLTHKEYDQGKWKK